ncbi:warthog protein 6-like [Hydra vulgaris]|uniref:warthog protein 6-like n=1 Tax=Hydra vulgaris TaxID=6087 RepID=UPI0006414869|nr:warthog protein 6-like [Hydra vulgaris]
MSLVTIKPTVSKDISTVTNRQKIVEGEIAKSDDPKCFPEKALVYVKGHNSPITLNKLKVRDEALSFDTSSQQLVYSPVDMFGNKDGSIITTFIYIQTSNGFSVTLSAKHMIMVENISNIDVKFADQVLVGDTLLQIETKDNKMIIVKEKVTKISNVISKGIYSPFTKTGTIIVDSTLVSCYAHVSNLDRFGLFRISGQKLAHSFLAPFRVFYDFGIIRPMEISIGQTMPFNIEVALEKFRSFLKF